MDHSSTASDGQDAAFAHEVRVMLGRRIRRLRAGRRISQETLAERSQLSVDTVRRLERAAYSPSLETLAKLCNGLGLTINGLFSELQRDGSSDVEDLCQLVRSQKPLNVRIADRVLRAVFAALEEARSP